jgi:non-specific serine/threonine protein kinase
VAGRLPAEVTSFVGRRAELDEIRQLLSTARLVTLTGVGGAGKTRLAVRVADGVRRAYRDGVWHVDLGALADGDLVEHAVVEALGLCVETEPSASRLLTRFLVDRQLLIVLDNCDHVLDDCAGLAVTVLAGAPAVRLLCTSRQPLGVVGETVFTVPPLAVAVNGARTDGTVGTYPAVQLFVERAVAVAPDFALGSDNGPLVGEICARLDGLPLAIELAAARLRALTLEQLAAGLADRFAVLAARHAIPSHHRGLHDAFGWSFDLCSPAEQLLWARLAVFVGSFDLAAATAVCASAELPDAEIMDAIGGLVDKSIVSWDNRTGQVRYRLLETVREYGLRRLPAGDSVERLRRRHRGWYLRLAQRFDAEWFGPDQVAWVDRLRADWTNMRAALSWCLSTPDEVESGQLMLAALDWFWTSFGALAEGRHWLDRAVAADPRPTVARGRAVATRTRVLVSQADFALAAAGAEEIVAITRTLDDPYLGARAAYDVGMVTFMSGGDLARAQGLLEDAVARFADLGTAALDHAVTVLTLALVVLQRGDPDRAQRICDECIALCRRRGDRWFLAVSLRALAEMAFRRGALADGERHAQEALRLHHLLDARNSVAVVAVLDEVAYAAAAGGDPERAARLLGASSAIAESIGQDHSQRRRYWRDREAELDGVRSGMGEAAYEAAYDRGRRMGADDAVRYALDPNHADIPARPPAGTTRPSVLTLTPRERQVAELVAQGMSNQEIAARLAISQRTAESHVEHILRKLGFSSRTQIVTWVVREPE